MSKSIKNKKKSIFVLFIALIFFGLLIVNRLILQNKNTDSKAQVPATPLAEVIYQPSSEDFANPERGFMLQTYVYPDQTLNPNLIKAVQPSDTLVWVYFRLDNYRTRILDQNGLNNIRLAFSTARSKGLKLVFRFIYNWGPGNVSDPNLATPDAPLSLMLQHINQIKPILAENSDVIAAMQAGFVGHYGEWHSSKYIISNNDKKAVLDALLAALPAKNMLQLRYPRFKELFYQGPLTSTEAYSGSAGSRIGHHNDCFLEGTNDGGTYKSTSAGVVISQYCSGQDDLQCWKNYTSTDTAFTLNGGESCALNPPRTDCTNALSELSTFHWSFLNNGYNQSVLNNWTSQGCMPQIRQRLGYRFVLNKLTMTNQAGPGGSINFHLELENKGFAAPFNPRPVILVLKGISNTYQKEFSISSVDPRRLLPGQVLKFDANFILPLDIPTGTYNVYLWLPDPSPSLRLRPEYAIRMANLNMWQPATGYNLLFNNLVVNAVQVTVVVTGTKTPTPSKSPTQGVPTLTTGPSPTILPNAAKLRFKISLPDISSSVTNIPSTNVRIELKDGANLAGTSSVNLVRNGNYFQPITDVPFDIQQNKTYTILVKTDTSLRRVFAGVSLTRGQVLDCTGVVNNACGELISQRDNKVLYSGDSDGFNTVSGSFNKIDSADLQVLAIYFNQPAGGSAGKADFTKDGNVDISDLDILGRNYGKSGE